MSNKLNRDEILREMLSTLVKGWGPKAVYNALGELTDTKKSEPTNTGENKEPSNKEPKTAQLVENLSLTPDRKRLLLKLASAFDSGLAFPRITDVKAFLASHHQDSKEIKTRHQAFKMMIPILVNMSDKGLLRLISRSHQSGPANLNSISDAIKDAGQKLRGPTHDGDNELN